jgi:hypothetical protein
MRYQHRCPEMTFQPSCTCGWCICGACDSCLASAMKSPPDAHETGLGSAAVARLGPPMVPSLGDE